MKKIFLLFMGLVLFSDYAFAYEEIDLKRGVFSNPDSQNQIPINATQSSTAIDILFLKGAVYKVIVTGAEGIVYQNEITVKTFDTVIIDISQYKSGNYSIYFYDKEGNEITGDFVL
ncbi:DUF3244 domain-containing protein [Phocaeicola coprocola]|jgi:hypothetical protein|uniref:DUF3244 domain-containing protein n=1 Tax=Phocaeicola coprocola TaxID=310298 RepID=UPI00242D2676|nr:DUF3244 domain-containing protein [Phocaeicola coprocola]